MTRAIPQHLRRWGVVYVLLAMFLASWAAQFLGQYWEMRHEAVSDGEPFDWNLLWAKFTAQTFENWQSEWLQLLVQAVVLLGMKHLIFKADAEDMERLELKVDRLLAERGIDAAQIRAPTEPSGQWKSRQ